MLLHPYRIATIGRSRKFSRQHEKEPCFRGPHLQKYLAIWAAHKSLPPLTASISQHRKYEWESGKGGGGTRKRTYVPKLVRLVIPTLLHTATCCNTLQHAATRCNTLQHDATRCNTLQHVATRCNTLQHAATRCNTLQHDATRCNTLPRHLHAKTAADRIGNTNCIKKKRTEVASEHTDQAAMHGRQRRRRAKHARLRDC